MVYVYPTSRTIRNAIAEGGEHDRLLSVAMTMDEFETRIVTVPDRIMIDGQMRLVLLDEASRNVALDRLGIDRDFLHLLKTSDFIFRFFDELAAEGVAIHDLETRDTYAQYADHLGILSTLWDAYRAVLQRHGFYDTATRPSLVRLNGDYVKSLGEVFVVVEGYLSGYEWRLLEEASSLIRVTLRLTISRYHPAVAKRLAAWGFCLQEGTVCEVDLGRRQVREVGMLPAFAPGQIELVPVAMRVHQLGMIKETIAQWCAQGMEAHRIAVVLPDEGFAEWMDDFDTEGLFNFAMGTSYKRLAGYRVMDAVGAMCRDGGSVAGMDPSLAERWKEEWKHTIGWDRFMVLCEPLLSSFGDAERATIQTALFPLSRMVARVGDLPLATLFYLAMERIGECRNDDVRGGKVTVLGVLETRGVTFDGVIVVDFNESRVPRKSVKDLFLNSQLRARVGLPTRYDRENLQKFFYEQLLRRAKKGAIAYVVNDQESRSRFADELLDEGTDDERERERNRTFASVLFERGKGASPVIPVIEGCWELPREGVSASRLADFARCRRKYYWKYIVRIAEPVVAGAMPSAGEIGEKMHAVMAFLGQTPGGIVARAQGIARLETALRDSFPTDPAWELERRLVREKLLPWIDEEIRRHDAGYRVAAVEKTLTRAYGSVVLTGRLDRIDATPHGTLEIIDFKSGKVTLTQPKEGELPASFQSAVYALLGETLGEVDAITYVQLSPLTRHAEAWLDERLEQLSRVLEEYCRPQESFPLCDEAHRGSVCRFCPYTSLCGRES